MIDTNKLTDKIKIYQWDHKTEQVIDIEIQLIDAIINPQGLSMARLGVILLNKFREDLGLEPLSPNQNY